MTEVLWLAFLAVIMVFFALLDAGYFYRGQHRGVYPYKLPWPRGLGKLHDKPCEDPSHDSVGTAYITITPSTLGGQWGAWSIPALQPGCILNKREVEAMGGHGRIGEWGDSIIDRADTEPLCVTAKTWLVGDP